MQEEIFIPIVMFLVVGIVVYQYLKNRHEERLALIEKADISPELKNVLRIRPVYPVKAVVKWAFLILGLGLALVIGGFIEPYVDEMVVGGLIFGLPGIMLLVYYKMYGKLDNPSQ
jgi:hypothetical protein